MMEREIFYPKSRQPYQEAITMGFLIINLLRQETIQNLNDQFNLDLTRTKIKGSIVLCNDIEDTREFNGMRAIMQEDIEVDYNKQTY